GGVYRYVVRHCRPAAAADEVFQDVWTNLIRARASYVPSAKFTTYLYRLAHNRLVDHYRAHWHVVLVSSDDDEMLDLVEAQPVAREHEPDARAETRELGARLQRAPPELP